MTEKFTRYTPFKDGNGVKSENQQQCARVTWIVAYLIVFVMALIALIFMGLLWARANANDERLNRDLTPGATNSSGGGAFAGLEFASVTNLIESVNFGTLGVGNHPFPFDTIIEETFSPSILITDMSSNYVGFTIPSNGTYLLVWRANLLDDGTIPTSYQPKIEYWVDGVQYSTAWDTLSQTFSDNLFISQSTPFYLTEGQTLSIVAIVVSSSSRFLMDLGSSMTLIKLS